jgi:hypothetical protein
VLDGAVLRLGDDKEPNDGQAQAQEQEQACREVDCVDWAIYRQSPGSHPPACGHRTNWWADGDNEGILLVGGTAENVWSRGL